MDRREVPFASAGIECAATLYGPDRGADARACVVMGPGGTLTRADGIPAYAERFAAAGFAALAFDHRHWGDSGGEPRRWFSLREQLEDWRAAVAHARSIDGIDPDRIALWGMSFGGGHALLTAADDPRVAAVVSLAPVADGVAFNLRPAPPTVVARGIWRAVREVITRRPVTVPVAGPPGTLAANAAPEAVSGFESLTAGTGWRNEVNSSSVFALFRYRPVRRAADVTAPVLLQVGDRDGMVPRAPIERVAATAPHAQLLRYPMDHFGCFAPEHLDRVAADQLQFLSQHL
ncbi:MAG: alpha/beta hydrolase [Terrabacter sp.]